MAVPRLVRVTALVGGVVAIPIAAFGFIAGDLLAIAATHVFGDNEFTDRFLVGPAMIGGSLAFMAGAIFIGGWSGAKIGRWLDKRRNTHRSN
jgi:hypothetical protein